MELNFNNLQTDSNGRLRFSGISSGIDTQSLVDSMIEARRVSARQIEDRVEVNETRVDDLEELRTLATTFTDALSVLRSPTGFTAEDVFDNKQAYATSRATATAPSGHTASTAGEIMGITVDNTAVTGRHTVEVAQIARAHQVRSDAFTSLSDSLSSLGFPTGSLEINGETLTIGAADTLLDLRDQINNSSSMGLNASVISVSDTEHYLVLTSEETGTDAGISFGNATQAMHNALGLTQAGTDTVKNELQAAQNSIIRVDGLGVDIERQSNVIDDVLGGVTLELFRAEENTEIVLDVEQDLNTVKSAVVDFVDAYNALQDFVADQETEKVREEGEDASFGSLYNSTILRQINQNLSGVVTGSVAGLENGSSSLGQVGIEMNAEYRLEIDDQVFDNNLISDSEAIRALFGFSFQSSDPRVSVLSVGPNATYQTDGSGNPLPYYLNIAGTDASGEILSANLQTSAGAGSGGAADGSATSNGSVIEFTDATGADGMRLFFNGDASLGPVDDIEITYTRGIADSLFDFFEDLTEVGGVIEDAQNDYLDQNDDYAEDIEAIDRRLEQQRETLSARFLAMEEAMFRLEALREQLKQQTEALNGDS